MMRLTANAIVLLVLAAASQTVAFQPLSTTSKSIGRSSHTTSTSLYSTKPTTTSNNNAETSQLSGLVHGMLEAQRDMAKEEAAVQSSAAMDGMPTLGPDGVYQVRSEEQFRNLMAAHIDDLILVKYSSPFCQACKMLQPKFRTLRHEVPLLGKAILAHVSVVNKSGRDPLAAFVAQTLGISKIPSLQFYHQGRKLSVDNNLITCDPTK